MIKNPAEEENLHSRIAELEAEIKQLKSRKKYGLVWEDKPEDVVEQCKEKLPVLEEVEERAILDDPEGPTNILIEGDNYHALSVLNYTHRGKIDVIYIDPPYNTGSKDFIYNDKYVDSDDSFAHSKWLSFMNSRLQSARNLLSESGVIFLSIDDNGYAQLKLLCDSIFGENSFLGNLTWFKRTKSTNSGKAKKMIQQKTEYILVYSKQDRNSFEGFDLKWSTKEKTYPHEGLLGSCRFENLQSTDLGRKKRDTMKFPILGVKPQKDRRWQVGEETSRDMLKNKRIQLVDGFPMRAVYPEDEESTSFIPFWSHIDESGSAETGKKELSKVVGNNHGFDTVKPTPLLKEILDRFSSEAVILDFFAGSGTTAHAILDLNKEDKGDRQFILCTNNDNKIAEEITYPRIENVIKGYGDTVGVPANLRYFKTTFVNKTDVSDDVRRELVIKSTEMICIKESTFEKKYDNKDFKIYVNNNISAGILFNLDKIEDFKSKLDKIGLGSHIYVFSLSSDTFESDFENLSVDHQLSPIPESILEVYKRLFK